MSTARATTPPAGERAEDFGILLNIAFSSFKHGLHEHLKRSGFEGIGPSFGYVFRLLEAAPLSLRELATRLDMTSPGALKIINDMEQMGYIDKRADDGDARVTRLTLTPRATKAVAAARRYHASFERDLTARIGSRDAAAARRALEDIVRNNPDKSPIAKPL